MIRYFCLALAGVLLPVAAGFNGHGDYFEPAHRLNGVGVDRERISPLVLEARTQQMIDTQTFTILRDPKALGGAERIYSPKLQKIFRSASAQSGLSSTFISSIAYLESWGVANAESPAGPKGIMATPIDSLKREHRAIEAAIRSLHETADRIGSGESISPDILDCYIDFIRNFADGSHHQKEEKILFPAMNAAGFPLDVGRL